MKPFAVQRYCSLSYSRLSTLRSPLTRGNVKLLCATPIHRASFVNDSSSEGAKSLSTCMHPSSRISEVLDGTMKIAQSSRNINKALGNGTERQKRSDSISKPRSQGELKADMDLLFCNRNICDKVLFDKFMRESFKDCKIRNISNFMRLAGKKSRSKSTYYLKKHLPYIASRLQSSIHSSWRYLDISFVIYGLQCLDENDRSYLDILSTMTKIVSITQKSEDIMEARFLSIMLYGLQRNTGNGRINGRLLAVISQIAARCIDTFDSQNVGNALYGLQGMSSEIAEVRELISALALKVKECTTHLNAQEVGNALYGLKGMGSGSVEVCALISALAPKVKGCSVAFDDQAVGNALYGLQGMSSDSAEVRALISVLALKVKECTAHLSAQEVGNAFYGLQGMSSDNAEVRALISALVPKVKGCSVAFDAQTVGNALYGLQGMSSDSAEVRELISALVPKIRECTAHLSAQAVGNALYGLQGMSSEIAEVRELISALAPKIRECTAHLSAQEVGNALYGICCLVGSLELDLAVDAIWGNIVHLGLNTSNIKTLSDFDIMCLGQSIVLCLPVLQGSLKEDDYRKWESVSVLIGTELSSRYSKARDSMSFQSNVERRMHAVLTRIFDKSDIMITHNEYLFNLFEADMVLRIPTISGDNFLINIEVDGIHHLREKSKRFCALRDEYLKSKGVVVSRIEVSALHDMSDKDVESWALDRLTNAVFEFEGL